MQVLDKFLPASEGETLQIETLQRNALSEWKTLAPAVVVFSIKHHISMLENEAVSDRVKEKGGVNWRATATGVLLHNIGNFIWKCCPISTDIVSALEEISQKFLPSHLVSSMEETTFLFDFPNPETDSQKELLRSFSSSCALPRWFSAPPDFLRSPFNKGRIMRRNLGRLHDYIYVRVYSLLTKTNFIVDELTAHTQLYNIHSGTEPRTFDGFGRSWIYRPDKRDYLATVLSDKLGVGACELAVITTADPRTGHPLNWQDWSIWRRWEVFNRDYTKAERA
ncbi:hypothetical protein BJ165DRAFT_1482607 [Panaeolus papilionaceus]|nr:hypothetical protein BJ165DRAFT_1482607 [Panaeolus papilionaceus]